MSMSMSTPSAQTDPLLCIQACCPHMTQRDALMWSSALKAPMLRYNISSQHQVAAFVGEVVVETGGFVELLENMNYSAQGLMNEWPSRFPTMAFAMTYARQPEKIGNFVYANRMGNGPPASGDGYLYRGRGLMQTTGKEEYIPLAKAYGRTTADMAAWMETPNGAAEAACWDWVNMKCGAMADAWQITALSIRINGGTTALQDRIDMCNLALKALGTAHPATATVIDTGQIKAVPVISAAAPEASATADSLMAQELLQPGLNFNG